MRLRNLILAVALTALFALPTFAAKRTITGTVTCDGKGVAGVVVSDGFTVVKTNAKGIYSFSTDLSLPQAQFVHISIPSGYEVERKGNRPQFYGVINREAKGVQKFDFRLKKVDQTTYTMLAIADSHVCDGVNSAGRADDREQYCNEVVPMLNKCAAAHKHPVYMCALGDMSQPRPRRLAREGQKGYTLNNYMEDTKVDFPIFNVIGNHDHNGAPKGTMFNEETVYQSRKDFNDDLGPAYYSFNIGREHYVVIDNTFVITRDAGPTSDPKATKGYWMRMCEYQHKWLAADMAAVDPQKVDRVVILAHCAIFGYDGKKHQMDLERMLNNFKGYEVLALIGHHHADHSPLASRLRHGDGSLLHAPYRDLGDPRGECAHIVGNGQPCALVAKIHAQQLSFGMKKLFHVYVLLCFSSRGLPGLCPAPRNPLLKRGLDP